MLQSSSIINFFQINAVCETVGMARHPTVLHHTESSMWRIQSINVLVSIHLVNNNGYFAVLFNAFKNNFGRYKIDV